MRFAQRQQFRHDPGHRGHRAKHQELFDQIDADLCGIERSGLTPEIEALQAEEQGQHQADENHQAPPGHGRLRIGPPFQIAAGMGQD